VPTKSKRESPKAPNTLRYDYIKDAHYRVAPANGVVGHVMPGGGGIFATFTMEYLRPPERAERSVAPDGRISGHERRDTDTPETRVFDRLMLISCVIPTEACTAIGQWLLNMAGQARSAQAASADATLAPTDPEKHSNGDAGTENA